MNISDFADLSHQLAVQKGFWDTARNFGEMIALCHSELSEALEEHRIGFEPNFTYYDGEKPCGVPSELADTIIRILDMCSYYGIDIENIILEKLNYNSKRDYKHGKEF